MQLEDYFEFETCDTKFGRADVIRIKGSRIMIELVIEHTHSCYLGDREHRHPWGWGCGLCPSCDLRRKGYDSWLNS